MWRKSRNVDLGALRASAEVIEFLKVERGHPSESVINATTKWSEREKKRKHKRDITQIQMLREIEEIIKG